MHGNKCHLQDEKIVSKERGQNLADEYEMNFFETSAKNDINVTEAFRSLVKEIIKEKLQTEQKSSTKPKGVDLKSVKSTKKKWYSNLFGGKDSKEPPKKTSKKSENEIKNRKTIRKMKKA